MDESVLVSSVRDCILRVFHCQLVHHRQSVKELSIRDSFVLIWILYYFLLRFIDVVELATVGVKL